MKFLWPQMLWLLTVMPVLVAAYWWLMLRRRKVALRYASLSLVRDAMGASSWRRHVPPALLLLAVGVLIVAVARPTALVKLPSKQETVILAMDVSGSMRAKDVEPNRLVAAQNAAKAFLADLPASTRVGIVAFAATASVVQSPTHSREDLIAAIDRFQLQRGTATGSAILVALATLFPDAGIDVSSAIYGSSFESGSSRGKSLDDRARAKADKPEFKPVPPGSYTSAAIIMLSDGQRTTGPDPLKAARLAADRGVRIYTVGVGTVKGETIGFEGWSFRAQLDEETLKSIAHMTLGEYFYAGDAASLKKIYQTLTSRLVLEQRESEITAFLAAAAAVLIVCAAALSIHWYGRIA
jgi:Ca-activated chloride channel family protein